MNTDENVSPASSSDQRAALVACYLGWTLDAFDYFLVVMCLTAIGHEFHKTDEQIAIATWVTLGFRPVGAFLFGLMADRYGRRIPLMIDLIFYSVVEVLCGFAPSFTVFLVLRALFGIGMGGEWGVGASLALEKAPAKWRGLLSGFLQQGYAMGFLLASLAYNFVFPEIRMASALLHRRIARAAGALRAHAREGIGSLGAQTACIAGANCARRFFHTGSCWPI